MKEIIIDDYFIELTDEGRGTIGYSLIGWKTNELMDKIFSLNKAYKQKEKECEELKKQHYETLKMLKHEYDGRQRDNEQWFTRCTENHLEDTKQIDKLKQVLQEIKEIVNQQRADIKVLYDRNTEIRMKFILQKISEVE